MKSDLIIGLLAAILVMLCVPQKRRVSLLKSITVLGGIAAFFYYVAPILVALLIDAFDYALAHKVSAGIFLLICSLLLTWQLDRKENKLIREGSSEAFDKRVEDLMTGPLQYDYQKAVEAATKVKNGSVDRL